MNLRSKPWNGEDAYIIGGGSSLHNFNWELLKSYNTIGCNDAYKHGSEICKICVFGDFSWWGKHKERLEKYNGIVVTNTEALAIDKPAWVNFFPREPKGLFRNALGWNGNTGAVALNLAIILGAKRIYLLGFDMGIVRGKTNWHNEVIHPDAVLPSSYQMFLDKWKYVLEDLKNKFPNREVVNVNDNSKLFGVPTIGTKTFWKT